MLRATRNTTTNDQLLPASSICRDRIVTLGARWITAAMVAPGPSRAREDGDRRVSGGRRAP
ncbi:hypothetical protein ACFSM7_14740 [Clavibacter michiganensis subsp. tessellarius]|uniref:hypothetical protein n=1 Tax=Clavibacter tessellarius TaxID=31965 RepID=UPI003635CF4D